jgi:glutaredoxin 2
MLSDRLGLQSVPLNITTLTKDDDESTSKLKNLIGAKKLGGNLRTS